MVVSNKRSLQSDPIPKALATTYPHLSYFATRLPFPIPTSLLYFVSDLLYQEPCTSIMWTCSTLLYYRSINVLHKVLADPYTCFA
jgi:hypothetical protein